MAFDRYKAISNPLLYAVDMSRKWVIASLAVLISSFMFLLLPLLLRTSGGSIRCSNVGLRLHSCPSPDEGS
ncbi:hypothetical protein U0070_006389, partial [Myodes glareolus]